ncbi:unnamed protein product [Dovyalis caffra]|uniref:Uncharacterized protein n=1 Tax=Dovyalis caffra TaxID=77055 RepID=A0AAV1QU11_9ROSI|nr:unnamed protein product [Dovyalis caffra]
MGGALARPFASRLLLLPQLDGSPTFLIVESESTLAPPGLPLVTDNEEGERRVTADTLLGLLPHTPREADEKGRGREWEV